MSAEPEMLEPERSRLLFGDPSHTAKLIPFPGQEQRLQRLSTAPIAQSAKLPVIDSTISPLFDDDAIFQKNIRVIMEQCLAEHPVISIEPEVLGGIPHLEGTRLSVGQILGRVRLLGSVKAVVDYYTPHVTEQQVKEAMAYAQSFIERACDPYQADDRSYLRGAGGRKAK